MVAFALVWLFASPAAALYREACWVQYRLYEDEWSQTFAVTCTYATGQELNARARKQKFAGFKTYAIIVWPISATSYIRIAESVACGFVAEDGCAERPTHSLHGREEFAHYRHGRRIQREWRICQPGIFGVCQASGFRNADR